MGMVAWLKRIPGLTKPFDNIGIWWVIFGPGGVLSVIMGWAASALTPIAQYGWGAVVFAGVGAACVIMFATSAILVAWRYFHPLPDRGKPAGKADNGNAKIQTLEQSASIKEIERDLLVLLDFSVTETTVVFLNDLYEKAPYLADPLKLDKYDHNKDIEGKEYIQMAAGKLAGTHRGFSFSSLMERTAMDAEYGLKQVAPEQRPPGIDPLDLRSHAITSLQCGRAKAFFWREKREAEQKLINLRAGLIDRLSQRNPS